MRIVTNDFKDALILNGREWDCKIIYTINNETITLGMENINSVNFSYQGSLLKSVMKQLEIDSDVEIPENTILEYRIGLKAEDEYKYISYGNFVVKKVEKQENTKSYIMSCYDKMVYSMKNYEDMGITYPITIRNYINAICSHLGLTFKNANSTFTNYNKQIPNELYLDSDGNSMYYTYRDVLDELAEVTASVICINEDDDELEIRYINNTNEVLDNNYLKDTNVIKNTKLYGPINQVVLSRSADSDQLPKSDETSILQNGLTEIKIIDNQILNGEDRQSYLNEIFNRLNGIQYSICDLSSFGILYFNLMDKFNFSWVDDLGNSNQINTLMLNNQIIQTQSVEENIICEEPLDKSNGYAEITKGERDDNRARIIINKMTGEIDAKVSKDDIIADLNLAIVDGKGVIRATGNTFILDADNASIDEYGNAEFENARLRGGNLDLEDNGTKEGASIKIHSRFEVLNNINLNTDLSGKQIYFNFFKTLDYNTTMPSENKSLLKAENQSDVNKWLEIGIDYNHNTIQQTYEYNFWYTIKNGDELIDKHYFYKIFKDYVNQRFVAYFREPLLDLTNYAVGIVTEKNTDLDCTAIMNNINLTEEVDKINNISGYGIETDIIPRKDYTLNDIDYVQYKIDNNIDFTENDISNYDLNNDGYVTEEDIEEIEAFILNGIGSSYPAKFKLNVQTAKDNLLIENNDKSKSVKLDLDGLRFKGSSQGLVSVPRIEFEDENGTQLQLDLTGIYSKNGNSYNNLLEDFYYSNNEEETFNNLVLAGHVSGSTAQIIFSIPTSKNLKNVNTIEIVSGAITVRGTAGYVESSGSSPYLSMTNTSSYTYTLLKVTNNMVNIGITKKSGTFSNVTNNTPVTIQLRNVKLKFTQSS